MTVGFDAEETIFERERIVTAVAILAFGQMITNAIFAAELIQAEVWSLRSKLLHLLLNRTALLSTLEIDGLHSFLIFFFRALLIEDSVLLLIEADTPETIAAAEAVLAELAVSAVCTILAVICHVAVVAVDALRAPLAT